MKNNIKAALFALAFSFVLVLIPQQIKATENILQDNNWSFFYGVLSEVSKNIQPFRGDDSFHLYIPSRYANFEKWGMARPWFSRWEQKISLRKIAEGTNLELSSYIKTENLTWQGAKLWIGFFNSKSEEIEYAARGTEDITGTKNWRMHKIKVAVPPGADYAEVQLRVFRSTGKVWFDDVFLSVEQKGKRPLMGVIRWDMYSGHPDATQNQEFGFLEPREHHWRAPWFVRMTGIFPDNPLAYTRPGTPARPFQNRPLYFNPNYEKEVIQEVMDQEIKFASSAGIDYWAFGYEPKHRPVRAIRDFFEAYLESSHKRDINFAIIINSTTMGYQRIWYPDHTVFNPDDVSVDWRLAVKDYVRVMKEETYQSVLNDRPLIYMYKPSVLSERLGDRNSSVNELKKAIDYLREETVNAGIRNPYIVGMDNLANRSKGEELGKYVDSGILDAISAYHTRVGGTPQGRPYSQLWPLIEKVLDETRDWPVVPITMSGANWEPRSNVRDHFPNTHYNEPNRGDIKKHISSAFDYIANNPSKNEANSIIMYAWNEHSEGGHLSPTMGKPPYYEPNTWMLDEVADVLRGWTHP